MWLFRLIQLLFLILMIRQIILVLVAWWTGTHSDVPFQSTKKSVLKKLIKEINIKPDDVVYELGSGSGRVALFLAKNTPAQIFGVEKNLVLYWLSKIKNNFQKNKVTFINRDIENIDLHQANYIYTYFSPRAYQKFAQKFDQELAKGTVFIAWRYPFVHPHFKHRTQIQDQHRLYIYDKTS